MKTSWTDLVCETVHEQFLSMHIPRHVCFICVCVNRNDGCVVV